MIALSELNKKLENSLNENPLGLQFKVFLDTGKYKRSVRRYNQVIEIVNGLTTVINSDIQKSNDGIILATLSLRTDLLFKCKDDEEDVERLVESENGLTNEKIEGNASFIENVREFLDDFCQETSYSLEKDGEGNEFDVAVSYSFTSGGNRGQVPNLGDSFSFSIYAYYNIIQNGDNSLRYQFYLDGEKIPYLIATPRRTPTPEFDVYANTKNGSAKATISNTVWGLSLKCSSLVGKFSKAIKNFLLNGERNVAHFLDARLGDDKNVYLVFFGDTSASAQGILNAGLDVSFAESVDDYELISFPESFYIYRVTVPGNQVSFTANTPIYLMSSTDMKPIQATGENGVYTANLALMSGCYIVSSGELTITGATVIQEGV